MTPDAAKAHIVGNVVVTRQTVTIASAYILEKFVPDSTELIENFLTAMGADMPGEVLLHPTLDPTPTLEAAAGAISWKLSACEAIWNLISSAVIFPASSDLVGLLGTLRWTTVIPGSGGESSGFSLNDLSILVPNKLKISLSKDLSSEQTLTNPDLYLNELDIPEIHPDIEISLRESVKCFRNELYLACLAMLGKASETAWVELGLSLANFAADSSTFGSEKLGTQMEDTFPGIAKKIQLVIEAYTRQDVFKPLAVSSGISLQDLRNSVVWADCVRESRNSLHYGVKPTMSNSYEKVAALLIGAVPHIKILVTLATAANKGKN